MPDAVIYPPTITTDKDKLFACYSLVRQMIDEYNRQSAIAASDKVRYGGKLQVYAKWEFEPRLKALLSERNRLKSNLWKAAYSIEEWDAIAKLETVEQDLIYKETFGDKEAESTKDTLATSPMLDALKSISLDSLSSLGASDPLEDYTTYTEVDQGSDITVAQNVITLSSAQPRYDTFYVGVNKGTGHFGGDFEHRNRWRLTTAGSYVHSACWVVGNEEGDAYDLASGSYPALRLTRYHNGTTLCQYLYAANITNSGTDFYAGLSLNTYYYITYARDDDGGAYSAGQLNVYICTGNYYGESGSSLVDTLSQDYETQEDFSWIYGVASYDEGSHVGIYHSGTVENLDLQEGTLHEASATVSGAGALAGIGKATLIGQVAVSGAGALAGIANLTATGKGTLAGSGSVAVIGQVITGVETKYPTVGSSAAVSPEDDQAWQNPTNIYADDAAYAYVDAVAFKNNVITERLKAQHFDFAIPEGATIDGIKVEIEKYCDVGTAYDYAVRLLDANGDPVGDDKKSGDPWTTLEIKEYGGASDDWNASLSAADINDDDFGVYISVQATTATSTDVYVDYIRITVYYTAFITGAATVTGSGALATNAVAILVGSSELSGIGILAANGVGIWGGAATLAGSGALATLAGLLKTGAATLSGVGDLVANGVYTATGQATLTGEGLVSAIAELLGTITGAATLSGVGMLAASGVETLGGVVGLSGSGAVTAIGRQILAALATLTGTGSLVANGQGIFIGQAALSGVGTLRANYSEEVLRQIAAIVKMYNRDFVVRVYNRDFTVKTRTRSI